ncbi:ATP-binding protein [Natronoglycomyces albus]|uniref:AAA family ATPase n=1 Tax=Natronoglycomyces albus TaxID=2811108 RepID=A0A895XQE8_9ACTN|nr:BTAD domain-containing putative transcriptional regulator [Natronoglycomyces albus]QSB05763.1 AAA family ATPase [Natronoglycomyces albus]
MRFGVLGPIAVWTDTGDEIRIPERKLRLLLAALLCDPGHAVSAPRLCQDLWPHLDQPLATLQAKISTLRRLFERAEPGGRALIEHRAGRYRLDLSRATLDLADFVSLTERARSPLAATQRIALLEEALRLRRGDAYADAETETFAAAAIRGWHERELSARLALAAARLDAGQPHTAAVELESLAGHHRLHQRLQKLLMLALYQSGRPEEALRTYEALRRGLADSLGIDPEPSVAQLHLDMLRQADHLRAEATPPPADLAPVSMGKTIGRDHDLTRLRDLLKQGSLITLTGPSGIGKTHVAAALAQLVRDDFPSNGRWVELAQLPPQASAEAIAGDIAAQLGLSDAAPELDTATNIAGSSAIERLRTNLKDKSLLLVLDNCEHVAESAATVVAALLRQCPGLRIVATSQEPLRVRGEQRYPVGGLDLAAAAELLVVRARSHDPNFVPAEGERELIAHICDRLDGVPLAIELAAARIHSLGAKDLLARLDDQLGLLRGNRRDAPKRQRTLYAALAWTWNLLDEEQQRLWSHLSIFGGSATLAAIEAVTDAAAALETLVERGLVTVKATFEARRYQLLNAVSAFGAEQLTAETASQLAARHHQYYASLAASAHRALFGPEQATWVARLNSEAANVRQALTTALDQDAATAIAMACDLAWYWYISGRIDEARHWLTSALNRSDPASSARAAAWLYGIEQRVNPTSEPAPELDVDDERLLWFAHLALADTGRGRDWELMERLLTSGDDWTRAATLCTRVVHRIAEGDIVAARDDAESAAKLFEDLEDGWGLCQAIDWQAEATLILARYEEARELNERGLNLAVEFGLPLKVANRQCGLGRVALLSGDLGQSRTWHQAALDTSRDQGYVKGVVSARIGLGLTARRAGELVEAEHHMRQVLEWNRDPDFAAVRTLALAELGFAAEQRGDAATAERLHTEGLTVARAAGDPRAIALAHEGLAGACSLAGQRDRARQHLEKAARLREELGLPLPEAERDDVVRIERRLSGTCE